MFLFTLDLFHNSFCFMNIFSLCYYVISHGIYTTIYFFNTYKSYDLFLSQPSLIYIVNHCIIMSNSHHNLIHNICNSSRLFVSLAFIISMIHCISVHTTLVILRNFLNSLFIPLISCQFLLFIIYHINFYHFYT
jgi:hypothetical protein